MSLSWLSFSLSSPSSFLALSLEFALEWVCVSFGSVVGVCGGERGCNQTPRENNGKSKSGTDVHEFVYPGVVVVPHVGFAVRMSPRLHALRDVSVAAI